MTRGQFFKKLFGMGAAAAVAPAITKKVAAMAGTTVTVPPPLPLQVSYYSSTIAFSALRNMGAHLEGPLFIVAKPASEAE